MAEGVDLSRGMEPRFAERDEEKHGTRVESKRKERRKETVRQKLVVRLGLHDDTEAKKAMRAVESLKGVDSVAIDKKRKEMTVVGVVDPMVIVSELRKFCRADVKSVSPAFRPSRHPQAAGYLSTQGTSRASLRQATTGQGQGTAGSARSRSLRLRRPARQARLSSPAAKDGGRQVCALALTYVMGQRYLETSKIMPAGVVAALSALMSGFYISLQDCCDQWESHPSQSRVKLTSLTAKA